MRHVTDLVPSVTTSDGAIHLPLLIAMCLVGPLACSSVPPITEAETLELEPASSNHGAFVWRGYRHTWEYNHRINRLGDYLTDLNCRVPSSSDCAGHLVHTSASGTGADEATFTSHYTEVRSSHATFHPGEVTLTFDGREQRDLRVEHDIRLDNSESFEADDTYTVLLNGYDLYTDGERAKAKKLKTFRLWARHAEYDESGLQFNLGGMLNMNCDSFECKHQSNRVRYTMDVRFLVIASEPGGMNVTSKHLETSYQWSKRREIEADDVPLNASIDRIQGSRTRYDNALLGFREIEFDLGKKGRYKDHWYVQWRHSIRNVDYEPSGGESSFNVNLFFKEWNQRTKKKVTSLARRGEATLRADVAMVQLRKASTRRRSRSGTLQWRGNNQSPVDDSAIWRRSLEWSPHKEHDKGTSVAEGD